MLEKNIIDTHSILECVDALHSLSDLGFTVSDSTGNVTHQCGFTYNSCQLCSLSEKDLGLCHQVHLNAMSEAERFGGKYVYMCPLGLSFFNSLITDSFSTILNIVAGPFLMVDKQDYLSCDLLSCDKITAEHLVDIVEIIDSINFVPTNKVNKLLTLLHNSTGFLNKNNMKEKQYAVEMNSNISSYIHQLKHEKEEVKYPIETEKALLEAIKSLDKTRAQALLNELLGYFLFSGHDFNNLKIKIYNLFVLINRAVIDCGADADSMVNNDAKNYDDLAAIKDMDSLNIWLKDILDSTMDMIFNVAGIRHHSVINKSVRYINTHFSERISLSEIASNVYLSPTYFSKIFKANMGESVVSYLNRIRVEQSKPLLGNKGIKLVDIAQAVGFEDQSYFTKVFKNITGMTPMGYRQFVN